MKIALDGSLLGARFSGVERSVAQLIHHLPAAGAPDDQFIVFVGQAFDDYVDKFHPGGFPDDPRLRIVRTGVDNSRRSARVWWQQMVLPRLVHGVGADVFHGPAYIAPGTMACPFVVTLYDLISLDHAEFAERYNRLYYQLFLPRGVKRAQRVIVPSGDTRRAVARRFPHAYHRTVTIPLGVEERFSATAADDDAQVREQYRLTGDYLLWVGNVEPKKNVGVLLKALARRRDRGESVPHLAVVGDMSWGTNDLMRVFLEHGLQSSVNFCGRVRDPHLPALYRGARALLFPSKAEGFGLPPLEAMASGTPVAVSDAGSLPEVVGDAALVVPVDDVDAWADAIGRLTTDDELRSSLIDKGLDRAAQFTWAKTAAATLSVYRAAADVGEDDYDHATGHYLDAAD